MLGWLLGVLHGYASNDNCVIDKYFDKLEVKMNDLLIRCDSIDKKLDTDINELTQELRFYKSLVDTVAEAIPDMMWCKDLNGKYLYANASIRDNLLFDRNPIGKGDIELALAAKERFGAENHTFGEKCTNSDKVVIDLVTSGVFTKEDGRFLESGKVKGSMMYLEVFKAPLFADGELIGTVGTGRPMTEYVEAFRAHNCKGCQKMTDIFSKYEYGE